MRSPEHKDENYEMPAEPLWGFDKWSNQGLYKTAALTLSSQGRSLTDLISYSIYRAHLHMLQLCDRQVKVGQEGCLSWFNSFSCRETNTLAGCCSKIRPWKQFATTRSKASPCLILHDLHELALHNIWTTKQGFSSGGLILNVIVISTPV